MPSIKELKTKLESIPGKRDRQNLVGKLRQYKDLANAASKALSSALSSSTYIASVFPEVSIERIKINSELARKAASILQTKLQSDPEKINTKSVEDKFVDLREATTKMQTNVKDIWKRSVEAKVDSFSGLVDVANSAGIAGADKLRSTINKIRNEANRPPITNEEAVRIAAQSAQLESEVASLDLTGKGGEFLVAAARGFGRSSDLLDPEVIAFINQHGLWSILKVKLG